MSKPAFLALLAMLAACSSGSEEGTTGNAATIENAYRGVMQDRSASAPVEALYVEKCSMCHRQMGMGTVLLGRRVEPDVAALEQRDDLTADYIVMAARQGIGNMPRISRAEVSDKQLQEIADYLAKAEK